MMSSLNKLQAPGLLLVMAFAAPAAAQVNGKGTFQASLGLSAGFHATEYTSSLTVFGIPFAVRNLDRAATVSFPLDLQFGIAQRFSLGLALEPGQYIDSAGTRPNGFFAGSISPRYYLVNGEHFGLHLNADVGFSVLRIGEVQSGNKVYDDVYAGSHFRLGLQAQYFFGKAIGMHFGVKYAAHNMRWRDRDPEDPLLSNSGFEATLRTYGSQFQLGLQARF